MLRHAAASVQKQRTNSEVVHEAVMIRDPIDPPCVRRELACRRSSGNKHARLEASDTDVALLSSWNGDWQIREIGTTPTCSSSACKSTKGGSSCPLVGKEWPEGKHQKTFKNGRRKFSKKRTVRQHVRDHMWATKHLWRTRTQSRIQDHTSPTSTKCM